MLYTFGSIPANHRTMKTGIDVLLEKQLNLLRGRRVGLITNPTGVTARLESIVDRLKACPGVNLVALYGPEHGVRGNAQAGEYVPFYFDEKFGLPVYSLYGQALKLPADRLEDIDATMRDFDTRHAGKTVERDMLDGVEVLVYDLQDVGTRVYTYVATMAYAMQAAAEAGIPFVVLDRPNPINGVLMEGPILEYPQFSSFIGLYPVPLRHGLTTGELARLFNDRFLRHPADLKVVSMDGWARNLWYDATGLPWVIPSPNLPTLEAAVVYPGQVLLEGTNLSEGRGTTKPFELFGAPWLNGYELARSLNELGLPGVCFREAWFTPTFSKHAGARCGGCQLHVTDRDRFRSVETTLALLDIVRLQSQGELKLHEDYFDRVMGTARVREQWMSGASWSTIAAGWNKGIADFDELRQPYLLY